jgi:hypothetical protein
VAVDIPNSHKDLLEKPIVVTLTTISAQGEPYSVVVWKRWDGQHIFITSDAGKRKHRNILANANVAILVLDPDNSQRYLSIGGIVEGVIASDVVEELDRQALAFTGNQHYFGSLEPLENLATFDGVFFKIRPTRAVIFG